MSTSLGDSLYQDQPQQLATIFKGLRKWLSHEFERPFGLDDTVVLIGYQDDGHSCGPCVLNAMEREMTGVELFTDSAKFRVRMHLFTQMVAHLKRKVGAATLDMLSLCLIALLVDAAL